MFLDDDHEETVEEHVLSPQQASQRSRLLGIPSFDLGNEEVAEHRVSSDVSPHHNLSADAASRRSACLAEQDYGDLWRARLPSLDSGQAIIEASADGGMESVKIFGVVQAGIGNRKNARQNRLFQFRSTGPQACYQATSSLLG